ncbi:caspase-3-like [Centropristis striata]|uniref:caspase-3-like n=1 Tax=Centropristis striata TaxID=184440 RepID=UPI0027E09354|nr:caspase-3-like [Centropristis striata]
MSAKDTVRRNKTTLQTILCGDHIFILNQVLEKKLITDREYTKLKSTQPDVETKIVELVDRIMNKGEERCRDFLDLLQTDDIKETYPELENIQLNAPCLLPAPVQAYAIDDSDVLQQESKRQKEDKPYELKSQPTGLCVIINNENFMHQKPRAGTNKDAESLAEVFSWLRFRVLMFKDQTKDQMDRTMKCFASQCDRSQLQELKVQEWSGNEFSALQNDPMHGDAFICCILSHGEKGVVFGTDGGPLSIKQITRTFRAQSALIGKPKVFLIQACQGGNIQRGVLLEEDLQADDSHSLYIPEDADVLVAISTVEDYLSYRVPKDGSWFIQSLCLQLKEGCPKSENMTTILQRVNDEVGKKEGRPGWPGAVKQMPEVRFTLRKRLVLSPHRN